MKMNPRRSIEIPTKFFIKFYFIVGLWFFMAPTHANADKRWDTTVFMTLPGLLSLGVGQQLGTPYLEAAVAAHSSLFSGYAYEIGLRSVLLPEYELSPTVGLVQSFIHHGLSDTSTYSESYWEHRSSVHFLADWRSDFGLRLSAGLSVTLNPRIYGWNDTMFQPLLQIGWTF